MADTALLATLEDWLAPWLDGVTRRDHLARVDLRGALHGLLDWNHQRQLDDLVPTHLTVPSGSRIAVDYSGAAPALAVRLQEVFGWMESPRLAGGRVPVTLELLSPARRPVQVTRDLASFWARGYLEVRKELKGATPSITGRTTLTPRRPRAKCVRPEIECSHCDNSAAVDDGTTPCRPRDRGCTARLPAAGTGRHGHGCAPFRPGLPAEPAGREAPSARSRAPAP